MAVRLQHTAGWRRWYRAIGAAQAGLTVLVVGGAALGALLLHPDTGLLAKGRGPLGGNPVLVVGLALLSLLGGLALREKYQEQVGAARELNPVEQRMADGVNRVLLAGSLVVPLLVLVLHQFGSSGGSHEAGRGDGRESSPLPSPRQDPAPGPPPAQHAGHPGHSTHLWLTRILLGLGIALLVAVVVIAGLHLWRYATRPPVAEAPATYATLDDEQERLTHAVDCGRRALLDGTDARAAVIACYAAMEESLVDSGVSRRASDSPQDLLERAVAGGLPTGAAAAVLTALFREARYSTHPMDGSHRDRAAAALAEIADGLRSRTSERQVVTGTP
ncbi:membrane protein [Streptomyces incarnatus]|uniref:Membrane protein n=1 Tax=Streptomyces incarnatus TaxID=665007 RepID=A0ABN4G726_9ACTN|nr:membrane protein [Streptomyces incarnatus]